MRIGYRCYRSRNGHQAGTGTVGSIVRDGQISTVWIQVITNLNGIRPACGCSELIPVGRVRLDGVEIQEASIGSERRCRGARNASRVNRNRRKNQQNDCENSDLHKFLLFLPNWFRLLPPREHSFSVLIRELV